MASKSTSATHSSLAAMIISPVRRWYSRTVLVAIILFRCFSTKILGSSPRKDDDDLHRAAILFSTPELQKGITREDIWAALKQSLFKNFRCILAWILTSFLIASSSLGEYQHSLVVLLAVVV